MKTKRKTGSGSQNLSRQRALPGAITAMVLGVLLLLPGLYATTGFTLSCRRLEPSLINCTLAKQWLALITLDERPIKGLREVKIDQTTGKTVLVADSGEVVYDRLGGMGDVSRSISQFIHSTEPSFWIGGGLEGIPMLFGLSLVATFFFGLGVLKLRKALEN
jgi:hypothetical protein